jgi:apolipoprotein N-acyltransferase
VTDNYDLIIARYDSLTALAAAQDMDLIIYPEAAVPII